MVTKNPKVSVVITCYKYAHFLKECIESLRNQTYQNFEVIVVNDGSPDNTTEVCRELGVKCIEKENGGLSSARNAGIRYAMGEYIMCLDADDKLVPNGLKEHVDLIDDMKITQCALMEFGDSHEVFTPQGASIETLLVTNSIYCNALFPRKAWVDTGGYDESETIRLGYEDWEFWIRLFALGYTVNTSSNLALRYRIHQDSLTRTKTHRNDSLLRKYIYEKHRNLYEKYNITIKC